MSLTKDAIQTDEDITVIVENYWSEHLHDLSITRHEIGTEEFFDDLQEYHFDKQRHLEKILNYAAQNGKELLDIGCGVGVDTAKFASYGARVTGIDISERAITLARRNLGYQNLDATFSKMDGSEMEFEDDSFDMVYAHGILPYARDYNKIVREIYRVLKPGGEAVLQTYNKKSWLYLLWKTMKVKLEHQDAPSFHIHTVEEVLEMAKPFSHVKIITERFPIKTRLHTGVKGILYNAVFVGGFNALPRPLVRRWGWHILARVVK